MLGEVVVAPARHERLEPAGLETLDDIGAEEAPASGHERPHRVACGVPVGSQSTRPIQRSRFSAYHAIVRATPSSQRDLRLPARLAVELLVADAERHHIGRARPEASLGRDDVATAPVPQLLAGLEDHLGPVGHRDVLALAVDVEVARDAVGRDGEVAADAVGAEAEVAHRVELAELDRLAGERLRDDRARHVARVLARAVVVEHPRDDARDPERVVVVHGQEVRGDLRGRVDRLRIDRRALVQDQAAVLVEVVVVGDVLVDVAVLLGGAGGVELLELEARVDDRLEQVQRADRVRHHRLVGTVPALADVGLGAQVEDVRLVGRLLQLTHQVVDRGLVGEVGEVHLEPAAQVPDVVQRAARGGAHERVDVGADRDERLGQVRAHEAVGAGDQHGASAEDRPELVAQLGERLVGPLGVVAVYVHLNARRPR